MTEVTVNITGYRQLSPREQSEINDVKDHAERIGEMVAFLETLPDLDQRWIAVGKTQLQQGFMALVRAIAQPGSF